MKNKKKTLIFILFLLFLCLFLYSISYLILSEINEKNTNKQINLIEEVVEKNEVIDNENTQIIIPEEIIEKEEKDPYLEYTKMNLINVNFDKLKEINKDVKGWIVVNGTKVNYPFVQAKDNKYYLKHSFDKSYNNAGWVFLDYRNNLSNFADKNTIIYAHNMRNKTMFGSLKNILTNGWLNNKNNHVIKLSTEYENTLWQVFSIYHIPKTSDYLKTKFISDHDFELFSNMILNRSIHNFNTSISNNDKILTLSTCYTNKERLVLHAKLIKKETR